MIRLEVTDNKEIKIEIENTDTYHEAMNNFTELVLRFYEAVYAPHDVPLEAFLMYVSASVQKNILSGLN